MLNIIFLDVDNILTAHKLQINAYGGLHGIRDINLLESALAEPSRTFGGKFLYTNLSEMASAYLFHLIKNHPFLDGNKRTAVVAAFGFVRVNGYYLNAKQEQVFKLAVGVADSSYTKEYITEWLEKHIEVYHEEN